MNNVLEFEKIPTQIYSNSQIASLAVAKEMADLITEKSKNGKHCVLGLATGSTPKSVYKELIRLHKEEGLSFKNVYSFNLDEYYPMRPDSLHSYVRFMNEQLFNHIDIPRDNCFIPDGTITPENIKDFCITYEEKISKLGGIDFQLLGIGGNGHIGFNEPGVDITLQAHDQELHGSTLASGQLYFNEPTPISKGITLGMAQVMKARCLLMLANGNSKAAIIQKACEGPVTNEVPASYIQQHRHAVLMIDKAAAAALSK